VRVINGTVPVPVRPGGEAEKFLFYRGLGEFDLPLSVQTTGTTDDVLMTLSNRGAEPLTGVFAIRVKGGLLQYARLPNLAGRSAGSINTAVALSAPMPLEDGIRQVKQQLNAALARAGLFDREALAMTNTWEKSYFHTDGLRILYVLPRRLVDDLIPIHIKPAPTALQRVMVGRVEVLTPGQERDLLLATANLNAKDKAVRDAATAQLDRLGRLKEPTLRRLQGLSATAEQREQIANLIKALAKPVSKG
jgi:hypothetical protein